MQSIRSVASFKIYTAFHYGKNSVEYIGVCLKGKKMNNIASLIASAKENILFIVEFLGIFVGIILISYVAELIIKKKNNDTEKILTTRKIATIGVLASIAGIFMTLEIPIPGIPSSHKLEFGDLPALLGGFAFGPVAAVLIEFCKVFIKTLLRPTSTAFVGELANFMISCSFVLPATIIYWIKKTKTNAKISCVVGGAVMVLFGFLLNRFYLLPTFLKMFMGGNLDALIGMGSAANPLIKGMTGYAIFASVPVNLMKSLIVSLLSMWLYKPMSKIWKKK